MDDLISRQALLKQIDIDSDGEPGYYGDTWKFIDTIKNMPPALGTNLAEVGTDCISRQQAIEAIKSLPITLDAETIQRSIEAVSNMPSAEPKIGKWILDRSGAYCCSECMEPCAGYVMMKPRDKFCKMCGSRNEVTT